MERGYLIYILPIVIISIGIIYCKHAKKINFWYIISLIAILCCDIFWYYDFIGYFCGIGISISIYFLSCSLALKKLVLLDRFRFNILLSIPILLTFSLISYVILSVYQLVEESIVYALPVVIASVFSQLMYSVVFSIIYLTDVYKNGVNLLISGVLSLFQVPLIVINELYHYDIIYTIPINIAHILGLYMFMKFILNTTMKEPELKKEKYL